MADISLDEAIARFALMSRAVPEARGHILKSAAEVIQKEARDSLGHYQDGWPELKETTKMERIRQGYPENEPLKRSGLLGDHIEIEVEATEGEAVVGVKNEEVQHPYEHEPSNIGLIAETHERGDETVPPRPFLGPAAHGKAEEVASLIGDQAFKAMLSAAIGGALSRISED